MANIRALVRQCVNPEYLEIVFIGILVKDFKTSFYKEKLEPALLKIPEVTDVRDSSDYGNIYGRVTIGIANRDKTEMVVEQLKTVLPEVFDFKMNVTYKELSELDYR